MRRAPTPEEFTRIMAVMDGVSWRKEDQFFSWGTPENKAEAKKLTKAISGHWASRPCYSCYIKCLDILREGVGLPPVGKPASPELTAQRMAICTSCKAFRKKTASCGRLGIDALTPKAIEIDGNMVNPCGCYLPWKTSVKWTNCPAGKW